jgi:CRISPR system Cascade subunit CasE
MADTPDYFMSRVTINSRELLRAHIDDNDYESHRTLWKLFPAIEPGTRPFLFRLEDDKPSRQVSYLVVSEIAPCAPQSAIIQSVQTKAYAPKIANGQLLQFSLRVNVSQRHLVDGQSPEVLADRDQRKSRRFDPVAKALTQVRESERASLRKEWIDGKDEPALLLTKWLEPKLKRQGFQLHVSRSIVRDYQRVSIKRPKQEKPVTYSVATIDGVVEVIEREAALAALLNGIGHSKAFGCGLMLVKPFMTNEQLDDDVDV